MLVEAGLSEARRAFLREINPLVRFELPSEFTGHEYHWHITNLLAAFILWLNPEKNQRQSEQAGWGHLTSRWNEEGTGGAKNFGLYKGIVFRDHRDEDSRYANAIKVFMIADPFEEFLREKGILYTRYNWKVGGTQEIVTEPSPL